MLKLIFAEKRGIILPIEQMTMYLMGYEDVESSVEYVTINLYFVYSRKISIEIDKMYSSNMTKYENRKKEFEDFFFKEYFYKVKYDSKNPTLKDELVDLFRSIVLIINPRGNADSKNATERESFFIRRILESCTKAFRKLFELKTQETWEKT